ncbi:Uncharacterised protein [Vibrio cholerae]|nr:Uncharacterised protein [Vibrio cholerae]CSC33516.1 Uncharacterised protein [Vibrio cholerae]
MRAENCSAQYLFLPAVPALIYPNDLELQVANIAAASSRKGIEGCELASL